MPRFTLSTRLPSVAGLAVLLGLAGLATLLSSVLFSSTSASAHFIGCDAVEDREIRWTAATVFLDDVQWAVDRWNEVGDINIAPDTASTALDLRFIDVNRSDAVWAGRYICRPDGAIHRTDTIRFNRFFLDGDSDAEQKHAALHELGHALRLGHSFPGQVMNAFLTGVTRPQSHDIADYCSRWPC